MRLLRLTRIEFASQQTTILQSQFSVTASFSQRGKSIRTWKRLVLSKTGCAVSPTAHPVLGKSIRTWKRLVLSKTGCAVGETALLSGRICYTPVTEDIVPVGPKSLE